MGLPCLVRHNLPIRAVTKAVPPMGGQEGLNGRIVWQAVPVSHKQNPVLDSGGRSGLACLCCGDWLLWLMRVSIRKRPARRRTLAVFVPGLWRWDGTREAAAAATVQPRLNLGLNGRLVFRVDADTMCPDKGSLLCQTSVSLWNVL